MNHIQYKEQFKKLQQKSRNITFKKNADYAVKQDALANFRRHGVKGILVRMWDKYQRIEHLLDKKADVKDESIEDTLIDLSNYALSAVLMLREQDNKKT